MRKITLKTADAVMNELNNIRSFFGELQVFKMITANNASEFADLANLES